MFGMGVGRALCELVHDDLPRIGKPLKGPLSAEKNANMPGIHVRKSAAVIIYVGRFRRLI